MPAVSALSSRLSRRRLRRLTLIGVVVLAVLTAMALDTTVVKPGAGDAREQGFSADRYGSDTFPAIADSVTRRAVPAEELAAAIAADRQAAAKKYGIGAPLPVLPVSLRGVVGEGKMGVWNLKVAGVPDGVQIRVQTGPAITGTDLRDATGTIQFGDFKNQIEYQNAGAAINQAMKRAVLETLDSEALPGKTVKVVGVFRLLNPNSWLVTPVRIDVQ
ncbi:DUF2291 family protein [Pantoea sp. 1.19]|uniref:DUF2291 family protein n=1 Tax=Pantoea sp. 1.19 TaxID=1925589 RepID=UPI000948946C|nr:DUF2291 family protein [Pantoea sp. 1.19]